MREVYYIVLQIAIHCEAYINIENGSQCFWQNRNIRDTVVASCFGKANTIVIISPSPQTISKSNKSQIWAVQAENQLI